MNELQKAELELLKLFIGVCKSLNIEYYLVCGTALGAAKYNGFIPWDDDIDVALLRPDYELFIKNAQKLLPKSIFLQNYKTDPAFPQIFSKLRNSNTTYIEKTAAKLPINHGVYIDIFPIDGYPRELSKQRKLERQKRRYKRQLSCAFETDRTMISKCICVINKMLGCHKKTNLIAKKYDDVISAFSITDSELLCNHGNWQGKIEYAPKWHYGNGICVKFEGIEVIIPEKYDAYLSQKYGDWRADLPPEKQIGHHYYTVCDVKRSFKYYINR